MAFSNNVVSKNLGLKVIVLLTDFGSSEYVGMMKGVIYSINPNAKIDDLTHDVTQQSVREGAWILLNSYRFFPKGSTFVAVVDPGVGTSRASVLVQTQNYNFIAPDNGLLYPSVVQDGIEKISNINIKDPESVTFHGRDVYAKFAAYFSIDDYSSFIGATKKSLDVKLEFSIDGRSGEIVHIDRFGNIITNLPPLQKDQYSVVHRGEQRSINWVSTYEYGPENEIFLVTGSSGTLELSMKNGSAREELPSAVGEPIIIE